jgi:hypothetical protein
MLRSLITSLYDSLWARGLFQEAFGCDCDGSNAVYGKVGDASAFVFRRLKKKNIWPPYSQSGLWTEEDIFDLIELLYDCVSEGCGQRTMGWRDCTHFELFNPHLGKLVIREEVNDILRDYGNGFSLSVEGEIGHLAPSGMSDLEEAKLPATTARAIVEKVESALRKFKRRGASWDERRDAIRDLADALEYQRAQAKELLLPKDERDLFELANNFGIRHHNKGQRTEYDKDIWYSWMFYYYLSTIHALSRIIERSAESAA